MGQKLFITSVLSFIYQNEPEQLILGFLCAVLFLLVLFFKLCLLKDES